MASKAMFPFIAEVKICPNVKNAMTSVLPDANGSKSNPRSVDPKRSCNRSELDGCAIVSSLVCKWFKMSLSYVSAKWARTGCSYM